MTFSRALSTALIAAAIAAPAASAQFDTRSEAVAPAQQDLRSPDARDAATTQRTYMRRTDPTSAGATTRQDLRTPDARDAAAGRGTFSAPAVRVVKVTPQPASGGGFDWADASIGAGIVLGLSVVAFGGVVAVSRRRQAGRQTATIA